LGSVRIIPTPQDMDILSLSRDRETFQLRTTSTVEAPLEPARGAKK
jgi:hypothetical protein